MNNTDIPLKLPIPFANSGTKNTIPQASQIGITNGAASLTDGFPPLTFTQLVAGGVAPFGADFNGIFYELSAIARWANAGGQYYFDSAYSTSISGYPKGSCLLSTNADEFFISTVNANTTDPNSATSVGWISIARNPVTTFAALLTTHALVDQIVKIKGHTVSGIGGGDFIGVAGSVTSDGYTQINSGTAGIYWQKIGDLFLINNSLMHYEIQKDTSPLSYIGTRAAQVVQWRDTAALGSNAFSPSVVFQNTSTGNGVVTAGSELSQSIWQGVFSSTTKTGDGSAHAYTATVQVGAYGAGGYNEGGLYQGEATNIGSALATISGCEMLIKDSPDSGATTYSTKMQAIVGRIAKYNPTIRKSYNFYASCEGTQAIDAILGSNPGGLATWQRGIDFSVATFSTGQAMLMKNNISLAWLTTGSVAVGVVGVDATDNFYLRPVSASSAVRVVMKDGSGNNKIAVTGDGVVRFDNATLAASATLGANGAPPAQVSGYMTVTINGTVSKIPYYNN